MDKYDKAIAYIKEHPDELKEYWLCPLTSIAGCLFKFLTRDGDSWASSASGRSICGCPSQVASGFGRAELDVLTEKVREIGIPNNWLKLPTEEAISHLPKFAEIQRWADHYFRGAPAPDLKPKAAEELPVITFP